MNNFLQIQRKTIQKLTLCVVALALSLCGSICYAASGYGCEREDAPTEQQPKAKITLKVQNKTLDYVLDEICKQAKVSYAIVTGLTLDKAQRYGLNVTNANLFTALNLLFQNTNYTYHFIENRIIIRTKSNEKEIPVVKKISIKGQVVDRESHPIVGAMLAVVGTQTGTVSDSKGNFFLVKTQEQKIQVSCIGYKTQTLEVKTEQTNYQIILEEDVTNIDDVVVSMGMFQVDKRHLTSSVTSLKAEDVLVAGINTIDQMLEGHVPGMTFMQNTGQVGASPKIKVRGTTTVLGSTQPLWVVDGIIVTDPVNVDPSSINDLDFVNLLGNAISGLNPEDIDKIDVLKDASATAIYGPKASNGVIVITTKKGKIGEPRISYSGSATFRRRPRYSDKSVNVMNSLERVGYSRDLINAGIQVDYLGTPVGYEGIYDRYVNGEISFDQFSDEVGNIETVNNDWMGNLLHDSFSHNHTLGISGGSQLLRYYASLGYTNENGSTRYENNNRYSSMLNINLNVKRWTANFSLKGNVQKKRYTPQTSDFSVADYAYNTSRAVPLYNADGSLFYYQRNRTDQSQFLDYSFNALAEMQNTQNDISTDQINLTVDVGYQIAKNLKANVTLSYAVSHSNNDTFYGENSYYVKKLRRFNTNTGKIETAQSLCPVGGILINDDTRNENYTVRANINYQKRFGDDGQHNISASLIGDLNSTLYTGSKIEQRGYLPDRGKIFYAPEISMGYTDYNAWRAANVGSNKHQLTNLVGLVVTGSYMYKNHVILNANMRIDASNKFGDQSNEKILPIWSVSSRWNLDQNVLSHAKWINLLALKTSFGYQGNMSASDSPKLIIKKESIDDDFNEYYANIKNFPNPNLRWEKTSTFNVDLEYSILKNKIRGTIGYYYRYTTDAYIAKKVSSFNGIDAYTVNSGTLSNQGFDFNIDFELINTMDNLVNNSLSKNKKGFVWRFNPNFGSIVNQLIDKAKPKDKVLQDKVTFSDYLSGRALVSGRPVNYFYSYKFAGLNSENGAMMFYDIDESLKETYDKMDIEDVFKSVMTPSGNREPVLQGGFSNYFGYGQWGLSINMSYSVGSKIRLLKLYQNGGSPASPEKNMRREYLNRWQRTGDEKHTNIPGILTGQDLEQANNPWWVRQSYSFANSLWEMYDNSDVRVVSGNYLKIQNISLRYVVPEKLCKMLTLKSAYVAVSGSNIYTFCSRHLKGQDPTQSGSSQLINVTVSPTYSFTLNLSF